MTPPTDFGRYVVDILAKQSQLTGEIDQKVIRDCLALSSSFLITDVGTNPTTGLAAWNAGLKGLVDVMIALHKKAQLEAATVSAASRACSECWSVADTWQHMENVRNCIGAVAKKLHGLLDKDRKSYQGTEVYTP